MNDLKLWLVIFTVGIGTYLIRFSFIGIMGDKPLPSWLVRMLRYVPVAVLPALATPLVIWPAATGGETDPARILAAATALAVGAWRRNVILSVVAGQAVLFLMLWILG